jgi:hypothetical protein
VKDQKVTYAEVFFLPIVTKAPKVYLNDPNDQSAKNIRKIAEPYPRHLALFGQTSSGSATFRADQSHLGRFAVASLLVQGPS